MRYFILFLLALSFAPFGTSAEAQSAYTQAQIDAAEKCGDGRDLEEGAELLCTCKAKGFDRFIWGTGPYSGHSDVCTAARHAGVITKEDGGAVVAIGRPGQKRYEEGEANGIKGRSWLSFRTSFDVASPSGASAVAAADLPNCGAFAPNDAPYQCNCPADAATGSVWGSGPYTGDSNICGAARHAGVVSAAGGGITVTLEPGQTAYQGSDANGIATRDWGSYDQSFMVRPIQAEAPASADVALCSSLKTDAASYDCACPAGQGNGGSVWGSGPFTGDSDICSAARHSGAVGEDGGVITITLEPGQAKYEGSKANGVTTSGWGSYEQSFMPAKAVAADPCSVLPSGATNHSCSCAAGSGGGQVWGSGPYTADSDICTAALHAGAIGAGGGMVSILVVPGLQSYAGSAANGAQTSDWDAFDSSIVFNRN